MRQITLPSCILSLLCANCGAPANTPAAPNHTPIMAESATTAPHKGSAFGLEAVQKLDTSGARAVEPFNIGDALFLAVPQLAEDIPGTPADMNGGNSDVATVIFRWESDQFREFQRIASHGSEDAEFFEIGGRHFLAICGVRSGRGPYNEKSEGVVYEFDGERFVPFQKFPTFGSHQWRYFSLDGRHFLALANGVPVSEKHAPDSDPNSTVFEWKGTRFEAFQTLPSKFSYDFHFFQSDDAAFLAHADHIMGGTIYRWTDGKFTVAQTIEGMGGRAFDSTIIDGSLYLAYANLLNESTIFRFNGKTFEPVQTLEGKGGRNMHFVKRDDTTYLIRINFITGPKDAPKTEQQSVVYALEDNRFVVATTFPTFGGTDAVTFQRRGQTLLAVSNSLSKEVRFRTPSMIYRPSW